MFISQVIFQSVKENEERLKAIMAKKGEQANASTGILSVECWRTEKGGEVGYCLLTKWESKDCFLQWMRDSHSGQNHGAHKPEDPPIPITKTGYQFEVVF